MRAGFKHARTLAKNANASAIKTTSTRSAFLRKFKDSTYCRTSVIPCAAARGPVRTASVGGGEWNKACNAVKAVSPNGEIVWSRPKDETTPLLAITALFQSARIALFGLELLVLFFQEKRTRKNTRLCFSRPLTDQRAQSHCANHPLPALLKWRKSAEGVSRLLAETNALRSPSGIFCHFSIHSLTSSSRLRTRRACARVLFSSLPWRSLLPVRPNIPSAAAARTISPEVVPSLGSKPA